MPYRLAQWHWTEPSAWRVTLTSRSVVAVWADGYTEHEAYIVFTALVDAERPPKDSTLVLGRTPTNPLRLDVAVARFPKDSVADVSST